jgi:hypothetical protein
MVDFIRPDGQTATRIIIGTFTQPTYFILYRQIS